MVVAQSVLERKKWRSETQCEGVRLSSDTSGSPPSMGYHDLVKKLWYSSEKEICGGIM